MCCDDAKALYQTFDRKNDEQNALRQQNLPVELNSTQMGVWIAERAHGGCGWKKEWKEIFITDAKE